ncbi:hypothetical protein D3C80_1905050 [compost metagenome]
MAPGLDKPECKLLQQLQIQLSVFVPGGINPETVQRLQQLACIKRGGIPQALQIIVLQCRKGCFLKPFRIPFDALGFQPVVFPVRGQFDFVTKIGIF